MPSYIQRITSIKDALQQTVDNIQDKENPSEADEEKADIYEQVVTLLDEATDLLESIG